MNHSVCDIAVGMILGYAIARAMTHLNDDSPLSDGAESMSEDRTTRQAAGGTYGEGGPQAGGPVGPTG